MMRTIRFRGTFMSPSERSDVSARLQIGFAGPFIITVLQVVPTELAWNATRRGGAGGVHAWRWIWKHLSLSLSLLSSVAAPSRGLRRSGTGCGIYSTQNYNVPNIKKLSHA
ncbi:unnamed protein product [Musa acuminata var. zebrina]